MKIDVLSTNTDEYDDNSYRATVGKLSQKTGKSEIVSLVVKIAAFAVCTALIFFYGNRSEPNVFANGLLAQIEVIISILLTVQHPKKSVGCIASYILNWLTILFMLSTLISTKNIQLLVGCIIPASTIFITAILQIIGKKMYTCMIRLDEQRAQLTQLSEETKQAYDEMARINEKLTVSNKIIEENDAKINQLAYFDTLTDLPNRRMIMNRLDFLKSYTEVTHNRFTVVFFDVDNFTTINDGLGHAAGDLLLREIADRLRDRIDAADLLGRLVGDEYALLIQRPISNDETFEYVNGILSNLVAPFDVAGNVVTLTVTVGASVFPDDSTNTSELFRCADIALHHAKNNPNTKFEFYDKSMREAIEKRADFEARLVSAIKNNELFMVYQPQYAADTKKLLGFEALVRWNSPELGFVSPVQFIPMAEETGHILELGIWILEQSCNKLNEINAKPGLENISVAVNISVVQLSAPNFLQQVKDVLKKTGVNTNNLDFEITESVFIKSFDKVTEILNELKSLGIRISLDDFGTGYSSLSYLHSLPIHTLKIDKSFIDGILRKDAEKEMVGSIINLAHNLSLFVISEGVETDEQFDYLRSQNCDCIQGFLLGKPMHENDMQALLEKAVTAAAY